MDRATTMGRDNYFRRLRGPGQIASGERLHKAGNFFEGESIARIEALQPYKSRLTKPSFRSCSKLKSARPRQESFSSPWWQGVDIVGLTTHLRQSLKSAG